MDANRKFRIMADGSDARTKFATDDYDEGEAKMVELSIGHWLGMKMMGPSGRILAAKDGVVTGHKDSNGRWVTR